MKSLAIAGAAALALSFTAGAAMAKNDTPGQQPYQYNVGSGSAQKGQESYQYNVGSGSAQKHPGGQYNQGSSSPTTEQKKNQ